MNEPRILRWQDQIATVASRWKDQYFHRNGRSWGHCFGSTAEHIYERLKALDVTTATPDDVAGIVGNRGWVGFWCDACHEYRDAAIQLGDEPDHESNTITLCGPCFDKYIATAMELRRSL